MVNHSNVVALDMTKQEVYKQLTSTKKWYMPHLKQQAASAFQARFEIRPYSNGPLYRFSEAWAIDKTDEQLFEFCAYHSSTLKSIK
jgi:hypothetical protein